MDIPSESLLSDAASGDDRAVDTLLERHLPQLRAFIRLRMGPEVRAREASTDMVQTVCREILTRAEAFRHGGETGFRQWLYRTAQRKIADRVDYYRAARRMAARERHAEGAAEDAVAACYQTLCTPSRHASARETLARVEAAFDELPDAYREVILGSRLLGLSHKELGDRMQKTEGATRALLFRAMARLTELIGEQSTGDTQA